MLFFFPSMNRASPVLVSMGMPFTHPTCAALYGTCSIGEHWVAEHRADVQSVRVTSDSPELLFHTVTLLFFKDGG